MRLVNPLQMSRLFDQVFFGGAGQRRTGKSVDEGSA